MHKNIFAYTALLGNYPEYVSINEQNDGSITVDVREPVNGSGALGNTVRMSMPREQLAMLARDIVNFLAFGGR